ncbi:NAD(P)/FAD-dependent oxidoreductase [Halopseudomonas sp. Lyrl_26]|uniref:NAD(P)/FAD-dependent oxidoreductase n=1 Tax=Halopseudomonas sp. Lyrl_26 TaxID=3110923 RepID=UPI003F7F60CE
MHAPTLSFDVVIIGAGASGLMCAATAGQRGRRVLVLEKANKPGKKILMSGGGRCNFTNYQVEADNFISANPHFCKAALKRYTQWDFISLIERHAVEYEERRHSQLFCRHSARDVLNMLLDECAAAGVEIRTHCELLQVSALDSQHLRYRLELRQGQQPLRIECHSLVVASGALSIPTLGGSGIGYQIAEQFGLSVTPRRAGLVPFMFSDSMKGLCERLSGLALEVEASCNGQSFTENMLFTHRGISGPAILQISSYWHPGDSLTLDLLPGIDAAQWLREAKQQQARQLLRTVLAEKLGRALVTELQQLWWPEAADKPLAEFSDRQLLRIAGQLNGWVIKPSATEGYRTAEVTLGGVDTTAISSRTMEARDCPGLYFIGEVLDVTGHLGGFNFQWAWSSGYSAGLAV